MKNQNEEIEKDWREVLKPRTLAAAMVVIAAIGFGVWIIANLWALLVVAILSVGALALYRSYRTNIRVAEGVTVTQEALKSYLLDLVRELEGDVNPDLVVKGSGDNLTVKLVMDFPTDPSTAADFHSRVIYLQGYLARRLYDDFRISGAKVEIDAANRSLLLKKTKKEEAGIPR